MCRNEYSLATFLFFAPLHGFEGRSAHLVHLHLTEQSVSNHFMIEVQMSTNN